MEKKESDKMKKIFLPLILLIVFGYILVIVIGISVELFLASVAILIASAAILYQNSIIKRKNSELDEKDNQLINIIQSLEEMASSRDAYKSLAELDNLTGLLNKKAMETICTVTVKHGHHAFFMIDLDHFKQINDTFGHQYGDEVICEFAKKLRTICRSNDCISRFGGDEFTILFKNIKDKRMIEKKAQMINEIARQIKLKNNMELTASIGIAIVPETGRDYNIVFDSADLALYKTKNQGKNGYTIF
jgi:diguanylate cyclase (GGDEF)-like protein